MPTIGRFIKEAAYAVDDYRKMAVTGVKYASCTAGDVAIRCLRSTRNTWSIVQYNYLRRPFMATKQFLAGKLCNTKHVALSCLKSTKDFFCDSSYTYIRPAILNIRHLYNSHFKSPAAEPKRLKDYSDVLVTLQHLLRSDEHVFLSRKVESGKTLKAEDFMMFARTRQRDGFNPFTVTEIDSIIRAFHPISDSKALIFSPAEALELFDNTPDKNRFSYKNNRERFFTALCVNSFKDEIHFKLGDCHLSYEELYKNRYKARMESSTPKEG